MIFFILIILSLLILILFASPTLSPIPYFPSNRKDAKLIIEALHLQSDQQVIDLGAGDGWVIFYAAQKTFEKRLNTKFIAVEINPILLIILHIRRLFHPNRFNIKIHYYDFLKTVRWCDSFHNQYRLTTYYLYISPWLIEKTLNNIKKIQGKKTIVSYFYPIKSLKPTKTIKGVHGVYQYRI